LDARVMLVDFTVENYRSYREAKTFSLVASSLPELRGNVFTVPDLELPLLRTGAIYGPNASGKSNLLGAMYSLSEMMESPASRPYYLAMQVPPFALDKHSSKNHTKFTVRFIVDGVLYKYHAALRLQYVERESLVAYPNKREQTWFTRHGQDFDFNKTYLRGQKQYLQEVTPTTALLLSVATAFEHAQLSPIARWLAINLRDRTGSRVNRWSRQRPTGDATTQMLLSSPDFFEWANAFIRHADLGIRSVAVESFEVEVRRTPQRRTDAEAKLLPSEETKEKRHHPYFLHSGEDEEVTVRFGLGEESLGTQRLFTMLAPLYDVFTGGQVAVIDELSASIHPTLVRELVRTFHDPEINKNGAQLIFATHDTTLLSGRLFRRDQVWFTEKCPSGATDLYSLQDVRGVRSDAAIEKNYLEGKYGAIPFFGQFDFPETPPDAPEVQETRAVGDGRDTAPGAIPEPEESGTDSP